VFVNNYDIFEFFAVSAAQLPAQVMWVIISAQVVLLTVENNAIVK
jgi:hypothetical protein